MYRPNRIGPWPIGNFNKALLTDAKADFTAVDVAHTTYGCYSLNVTSAEETTSEKVVFTDSTLFLSNTQQVGIGVQLTGGDEETNRYMYSVSGSLGFHTGEDVLVEMVIGRLAAAPSVSASIAVVNPIIVPLSVAMRGTQSNYYAVNSTVISTQLDGGSAPATYFDIAAFWRLVNMDGSNAVFKAFQCNISFHKYVSDILNFDPNR